MTSKALLIGATGNIGFGLLKEDVKSLFLPTSRYEVSDKKFLKLDPTNLISLKKIIEDNSINNVIILSAISKVNDCKSDPITSAKVNIEIPRRISILCNEMNIGTIFMSSEYVYNGNIKNPKSEEEKNILPLNYYGLQKYAAERQVLACNKKATVFRLPKVFHHFKKGNFLTDSISLIKNQSEIKAASDQKFSPISCYDLYNLISIAISKKIYGLYNCGGIESKSRLEFIEIIANFLKIWS